VSFYLWLVPRHRPFPFNVDANDRTMFSMNFEGAATGPVNQFEEELAARIIAQGAGTAIGTDIFIGPEAVYPVGGDGPYIGIIDTGGLTPHETHTGVTNEMLSAQIIVLAQKYRTARTRALAVWRALKVTNTTMAA